MKPKVNRISMGAAANWLTEHLRTVDLGKFHFKVVVEKCSCGQEIVVVHRAIRKSNLLVADVGGIVVFHAPMLPTEIVKAQINMFTPERVANMINEGMFRVQDLLFCPNPLQSKLLTWHYHSIRPAYEDFWIALRLSRLTPENIKESDVQAAASEVIPRVVEHHILALYKRE